MAQSGFTPIQLYFSTTASATPSAGNLANGELAVNITDGKLFYKDNGGVVRVLATAAGSAGDVVGPGSSTDNALVRFDGTTGKLVQNSAGVLDDSGNLTGLASVTATTLTGALTGSVGATTPNTGAFTTLSASGAVTLSGGTANGVAYLNASKVLTTGSALTFDGTNFYNGLTGAVSGWTGIGRSIWNKQSNTNSVGIVSIASASDAGIFMGHSGTVGVLGVTYGASAGYTPLAFYTNDSEQMRLTSTGLGIGTSSPSTKLTVHAGADGDVGFFRGGSTRQVQIGTSSTAGYINTDNGSAGLEIRTQGTARAYFDNSGNLGLGVTPSAWSGFGKTMEFNNAGCYVGNSGATSMQVGANNYFNGSNYIYSTSNVATRYAQASGQHLWFTAPSGTAGNAISFTQAMTLDASGRLLVGATSGTAKVTLAASSANGSSNVLDAQITSSNNTFEWVSTFLASNLASGNNMIHFIGKASTNRNAAYFGYKHSADGSTDNLLTFGLHSVDNVLNINGNAQVLIGTQSFGGAAKLVVQATGSNDGLFILSPSGGSGYVYSCTASSTSTAAYFITSAGQAGYIALSGNSTNYYSGSDYRLKNNVRPITSALDKVSALRPVAFEWKSDGKYSESFLAHELAEQFPFAVGGEKDAVDADGNPVYQCIDTSFLVATLTAAIQEQQAIINQLKARLDAANL